MLTAQEFVETEHEAFTPDKDHDGVRVPFGIPHIDAAFPMGVKPLSPQFNYIQGPEGGRKTTFALNIVLNMLLSGTLPQGSKIAIDTLESGMTIERYLLIMRCIIATKIIIYEHYTGPQDSDTLWHLFNRPLPEKSPSELITEIKGDHGRMACELKPDHIEGSYANLPNCRLTERQFNAYERAGDVLSRLPIVVFGVSEHPSPDIREARYTDTTDIQSSYARWLELAEKEGVDQIVVDHAHEYYLKGVSDYYSLQKAIMPLMSQWIKKAGRTLWVLGQESQGQQREADANDGEVIGSAGGGVLKAAAHTNFRVSYKGNRNPFWMIAWSPVKARRGNFPNICLMIEPQSGAIFGKSYTFLEVKARWGKVAT